MYSTKTAITNNQEFNSSYMPVGINENVTIKEVNTNRTPNGRDFLEIVFQDADGRTATMTEWKNEKNMWIKTDEDLQNRDNQQFGRILQVVKCLKQDPEFEGSSFVEMINWVKTVLTTVGNWENHPLRLKVVYDNKGYTKVSGLGIFVEPMTTEESQIKLFKRDLLERPVVADVETTTDPLGSNDLGNTPVNGTYSDKDADDLPF